MTSLNIASRALSAIVSAGRVYVCLAEITPRRGMSDVYSKAQHHVGWAGGIITCSRDEDAPRYRDLGGPTLRLRLGGANLSVVMPPRRRWADEMLRVSHLGCERTK